MKRNLFNLSNYKLFSCDMGELIPCGWQEVVRGDSFRHSTSALVRCAPMLAPAMHPVHARIHHWFVPYRLIWDNWEKFITGGPDGMNASVHPTITFPDGGPEIGTLADYLGVPPDMVDGLPVSALPFRAYALIWNLFYRDQDLQTELVVSTADGPDTTTNTALQNVAWEKDYFTSARPWPQKGPAITIPIGDEAPVKGIAVSTSSTFNQSGTNLRESGTVGAPGGTNWGLSLGSNNFLTVQGDNTSKVPDIYADLAAVSGIDVTDLREALAMQRFQEERSKFGSQYVDYLRYYGIIPSDARLQRPEYLGGGKQTIQFSEVLTTADTEDDPAATLKGHGIGAMKSNRYQKFFEEDGIQISLFSVKPKTMYPQGLWRKWNRKTKEDYFQKEFAAIGQQEVYNKEVYASHSAPDGVFGYQDRYDEYRRSESSVAGEFRSVLDYWHFARIFSSDPALNATFVKSVPPERVFADPSSDVLQVMARHSLKARRLLPATGQSFIY